MRTNIRFIKNMMILFMCLSICIIENNIDVYGCVENGVVTTCIWATTYDENKHWEYCTLCGEKRNIVEHTMVDNWFTGVESCTHYNYSTRICECGYSYKYTKPHIEDPTWRSMSGRLIHITYCGVCGTWMREAHCEDEDGRLTCKNPGTCKECNFTSSENNHYIDGDGKCKYCGEKFLNMTTPVITYASDYSKAKVTFDIIPEKDKNVELTGNMTTYTMIKNYTEEKWSYTKNSDGSVSYQIEYTFNNKTQVKSNITICDISHTGALKINGVFSYISTNAFNNNKFTIWQDHEEAQITEIKQVDQKTSNDWATIKELTITGIDKLSAVVKVSIIDKMTNEVIVNSAKAPVVDGKFTYVCTPPLEGPVEGREYICKVEDETGNILKHDFMIYKTDSKAPRLVSDNTYTKWSQTKKIKLELEDYGSGSVQVSITDQDSYLDTVYENGKYYEEYVFSEENYGSVVYTMYMRDGLGNATKTSLVVGKIDNTRPQITKVLDTKISGGTNISIEATDLNKKLGAQGSGVASYAITESVIEPKEDDWQSSNEILVEKAGYYYLWVKDAVGNISDAIKIKIDTNMNTSVDDKYIYDDGKKEDDKIEKEGKNNISYDEAEKFDETPKTGDYKATYIYYVYMIISGMGLVLLRGKIIGKLKRRD